MKKKTQLYGGLVGIALSGLFWSGFVLSQRVYEKLEIEARQICVKQGQGINDFITKHYSQKVYPATPKLYRNLFGCLSAASLVVGGLILKKWRRPTMGYKLMHKFKNR